MKISLRKCEFSMKKFSCILLALLLVLSLSIPAFAAEIQNDVNADVNTDVEATMYSLELTSEEIVSVTDEDGNIMPLSSISGYASGDISSTSSGFLVWVDSSGIGGMGVTVKTSCPNWNGTVRFDLVSDRGSKAVTEAYIPTNGSTEFHNLLHGLPGTPAYYLANFYGIPAGYTVNAQVWIYG